MKKIPDATMLFLAMVSIYWMFELKTPFLKYSLAILAGVLCALFVINIKKGGEQ